MHRAADDICNENERFHHCAVLLQLQLHRFYTEKYTVCKGGTLQPSSKTFRFRAGGDISTHGDKIDICSAGCGPRGLPVTTDYTDYIM